MIRVAIAEDIPRIAETVKTKLELAPDFKVKYLCSNGKELLQQLNHDHNVEVILMDINMPEMNGIEATEKITARWPNIKIIMLTVFDDEDHIFKAIMAGAKGYLMKDVSPTKIHRSLYEVLEGGAPMSSMIALKALQLIRMGRETPEVKIPEEHNLTPRETEILEHLVKGLSYEQIGNNLHISYGTVRKHIENVYRKLQVHNKVEAIRKVTQSRFL